MLKRTKLTSRLTEHLSSFALILSTPLQIVFRPDTWLYFNTHNSLLFDVEFGFKWQLEARLFFFWTY